MVHLFVQIHQEQAQDKHLDKHQEKEQNRDHHQILKDRKEVQVKQVVISLV